MFDNKKLQNEIEVCLSVLLDKQIINDVSADLVNQPRIKLGIFLTTSGMKVHLLGEEILDLVKQNKFFPPVATLRMVFEETVLLIFVLAKMLNKKKWSEAQYILTKVNVGRNTRDESVIADDKKPYNIMTAMEIADKYLAKTDLKMKGMLDDVYTAISDYVHPNAPSRYYFWDMDKDKVKFVYRKVVGVEDLGIVLNYLSMTLKLYALSWQKLNDIKLE